MKTRFLILIMVFSLPFVGLQAQDLMFVDYEPDIFVHNGYPDTLLFDFDNDGAADIMYRFDVNSVGYWFYIEAINPNLEFTTCEENEVIPESPDWQIFLWWFDEKMFGYRIKENDNYYYGWFRVYNYLPGGQLYEYIGVYFDKYAYCTIPDYPLQWGQTEILGVDENTEPSFATIHPNPSNNTLTITGESLRQIDITNMLGQRVATHEAEGPQATIDISPLPTGIYFVSIIDEDGKRCVQKVVKE